MSDIESTYKARDTEEWLDIKFYRPFGFIVAKFCQKLNIKPNTVSVIGLLLGIIGSHLIYYSDLKSTIAAIVLLVVSNAMDSADGQLARMTNNKTRLGRVLDGIVTNIIFLSVYLHLCLRMAPEWNWIIWVVALLAGISHSFQSAVADHYRNGYLYIVVGPDKAELDNAAKLKEQFLKLKWSKNPLDKIWGLIYLNYTMEQEMIAPRFSELKFKVKQLFQGKLPQQISEQYKSLARPNIKYYNILTTNTRLVTLFISLLAKNPWIYFALELIVLNALLIYVVLHQEFISKVVLKKVDQYRENVSLC